MSTTTRSRTGAPAAREPRREFKTSAESRSRGRDYGNAVQVILRKAKADGWKVPRAKPYAKLHQWAERRGITWPTKAKVKKTRRARRARRK